MGRGLLVLFVLIWQVCALPGQGLKLTVRNDNAQELPYAHIHINGRPASATDVHGVIFIDFDRLHPGDTLSASFLGTTTKTIVFDEKIKRRGEYEFVLEEDFVALDAAHVVADASKLFFEVTNILPPVNKDCTMEGAFDYAFFRHDRRTKYTAQGSFVINNLHRASFNRYVGWWDSYYRKGLTASSSSDTTVVRSPGSDPIWHLYQGNALFGEAHPEAAFRYSIQVTLSLVNRVLYTITTRERKDLAYRYLGQEDDSHIFRITYPNRKNSPLAYQLIVYVDTLTKNMKQVELTCIDCTARFSGEDHIDEIRAAADLEVIDLQRSRKSVLTTQDLQYTFLFRNGSIVNTTLSREKIVSWNKNRK